jgi:hypothetical protein
MSFLALRPIVSCVRAKRRGGLRGVADAPPDATTSAYRGVLGHRRSKHRVQD